MKRKIMAIGAVLAWVCGVFGATHEGVQLWENGPLWAKTNVGANSPTEAGYYFWWGDTLGYKWQNSQWVASDGSVNNFSFSTANCPTFDRSLEQLQTMGFVDADGKLLPAYDAAVQQWGDDWRMPKASELRNLIELCSWSWTTNNGVAGYTVTGKGLYSGNSIFIPDGGYIDGTTAKASGEANLWSSIVERDSEVGREDGTSRACLKSMYDNRWCSKVYERYWGFSIRPVKSMSAAKAASAVALDTRTGERLVVGAESIAYDTAWGGASSGTLKVNGTAVSGLSSKGAYSWFVNTTTATTNRWLLTYAAGTANYSATFWTPLKYSIKFNANGGSGTMSNLSCTQDQNATLTANAFTRPGYVFLGWMTSANGTTVVYKDKQCVRNLLNQHNGTLNLYAKWTDKWYVDTTGDDANEGISAAQPFKTIQHAIDQSVDGMKIIVADGTYAPINSNNKSITILSVNGAATTIIDGGGTARCAYLASYSTTVSMTNTTLCGFTLRNGYASFDGGGAQGGSLHDCQIISNRAERHAGGACYSALYDCRVEGNSCGNSGGGVHSASAYDCLFLNNSCTNNGAAACYGALVNCVVTNNLANRNGGGMYSAAATNCIIVGNVAYNQGGGVMSGTYDQCEIVGNTAKSAGGGVSGGAVLSRCVVKDNTSGANGGGACESFADNCLFFGNKAPSGYGGGFHKGVMNNCVVYGNSASRGGGVDGYYGVLTNNNSIVWGNSATTYPDVEPSAVVMRNCFTGNPRFVDAANGDFRLKGDSPCIDMGNNKYVSGETDIRGNARIQNGIVDIGAYEFTLPTELGNVPVEGTDAAVPVEWLGAYGYVNEDSTPASLQQVMVQTGDNGIPLWESWVAGLDPWDPESQLQANIEIVDGEPQISWTPDLSDAEPKRHYTTLGKTNLTDSAWVIPVNEEHHFFKVTVTMGEPGLARGVAATEGTSDDEVTLSWNPVTWAVSYNVYRGTVNDFGSATLMATVDGTGFVDDTAVPGTLYYYWIVSVANGGEWRTSDGTSGYRKIGAPQHVAASDGTSADWITVTWDAVEGAVSYSVFRKTAGSEEEPVEVGMSAGTSWMDLNATSGVTYVYRVAAVGAGMTGAMSASDEGYLRLPAPEGVTATNGSLVDRVDVAWSGVAGASHYRVYRSTAASGSKTPVSGWQTALAYSDTTAEPGVSYWYFVSAAAEETGLNSSGYSAGAAGSRTVGVPTGVYATDGTSETGVTVSWNATPGADGYKLYRNTANNPDAAEVVASVSSVSFEDTTALPGTLYFYWVAATNAVSESAKSAVETGFRAIPAPEGVTATTTSGATAVTVSWQPVVGAAYYRIYRGTKSGEDFAVEIDTTTETSYADESGAAGKTYYYSVTAVGASSESGFSAFVAGRR